MLLGASKTGFVYEETPTEVLVSEALSDERTIPEGCVAYTAEKHPHETLKISARLIKNMNIVDGRRDCFLWFLNRIPALVRDILVRVLFGKRGWGFVEVKGDFVGVVLLDEVNLEPVCLEPGDRYISIIPNEVFVSSFPGSSGVVSMVWKNIMWHRGRGTILRYVFPEFSEKIGVEDGETRSFKVSHLLSIFCGEENVPRKDWWNNPEVELRGPCTVTAIRTENVGKLRMRGLRESMEKEAGRTERNAVVAAGVPAFEG